MCHAIRQISSLTGNRSGTGRTEGCNDKQSLSLSLPPSLVSYSAFVCSSRVATFRFICSSPRSRSATPSSASNSPHRFNSKHPLICFYECVSFLILLVLAAIPRPSLITDLRVKKHYRFGKTGGKGHWILLTAIHV